MKAKDKAEELFNKMDMVIYTDQDNWKSQCKECALIGVDEIIEILWHTHKNEIEYRYWQEVKQEIIKL